MVRRDKLRHVSLRLFILEAIVGCLFVLFVRLGWSVMLHTLTCFDY